MTVDEILTRFDGVEGGNGKWTARCPGHEDNRNSLSIGVRADDGATLLNCHAGCPKGDILAAVGLEFRDLFQANGYHASGKSNGNGRGTLVKSYDYRTASGELLFQACRYEPKNFIQRRPDGSGGWIYNLQGVKPIPYRLQDIIRAGFDDAIFIAEGEKDCDALAALGLVATCNAGGAKKWKPEFGDWLQDRDVYILPDNDSVGEEHAEIVARSADGKAASVRIVRLPGLPDKGDVSDWLAAGGTKDELLQLAASTATSQPGTPSTDDGTLAEADDDPHRLGRAFIGKNPTLVYWRDEFRAWDGTCYRVSPVGHVRGDLHLYCKAEADRTCRQRLMFGEDDGKTIRPFKVTIPLVNNTLDAVRALSLQKFTEAPCWMPGATGPNPSDLIVGKTKLFNLRTGELFEKTPQFFCTSSLTFDPDPNAPEPLEWLRFGEQVFRDDPESWQCLQEWFGLLLTSDTKFQKILCMVGPPRSGKGTILRINKALTGADVVAAPTVTSFAQPFGLAGLLDKTVCSITDARFSGEAESGLVQHLLAISGEDTIDIHRKFLPPVTTKLSTRVILVSNDCPRFTDASGALASRLILLHFTESFLGREDVHLDARLLGELPGILNWSIEGWRRLYARGYFIQPQTGLDAIEQIQRLSSPILAFVRDCCEVAPGYRIEIGVLFDRWKEWCAEENRREPGTRQHFGRNLSSAFAGIKCKQGTGGFRFYEGIKLSDGLSHTDPF